MIHVLMFLEAKILTGKEKTHRCGRGKVRKANGKDFPAIQGPGCQSWLGDLRSHMQHQGGQEVKKIKELKKKRKKGVPILTFKTDINKETVNWNWRY